MKFQHTLAAGLCGIVAISGFAAAASPPTPKPRKTSERLETVADLTPEGLKLEAGYGAMLETLRAGLKKQIPTVAEAKQAELIALLKAELVGQKEIAELDKALRNSRTSEDRYNSLVENLRNAPSVVTKAEQELEKARALPDSDPTKAKLVADREKQVNNAKRNLAKLPGEVEKAKQAFENAGAEQARLTNELEAVSKSNTQAVATTLKALESYRLDPLLGSDKLDAKLAQFVILSEATPRFLAQFAQKGPDKKKLVDQLLADTPLMFQMVVADGAYWGKYGEAMEIYQSIRQASPKSADGVLQRLAVATSLVHGAPLWERHGGPTPGKTVDPLKRYFSYEKAILAGELDPVFKDLSTWELTFVVDGDVPAETLEWGRQWLRGYRPDLLKPAITELRYSQVVDHEIQYLSKFVSEDRPELAFMQNVLANGGICGRRAFFGRFILRSFGIPTTERREPGHATLAQWTPDGWLTYLGGNWGGRGSIDRYGRDLHFLASSQAREHEKEFMRVKRAQWIGDLMGEKRVFGFHDQNQEPQFWYAVSVAEQNRINHGKKTVPQYSMPAPTPTKPAPASASEITVDANGVITIPAVATKIPADNIGSAGWGKMNVVSFMESELGGMQLHYSRYGTTQALEYTFEAPKAGTYELTSRMIPTRWDMSFLVSANAAAPVTLPMPYNGGLWDTSEPIKIELKAGSNTLMLTRPEDMRKGVSIKDFTLTPVK